MVPQEEEKELIANRYRRLIVNETETKERARRLATPQVKPISLQLLAEPLLLTSIDSYPLCYPYLGSRDRLLSWLVFLAFAFSPRLNRYPDWGTGWLIDD